MGWLAMVSGDKDSLVERCNKQHSLWHSLIDRIFGGDGLASSYDESSVQFRYN